MAIAGSKMKLEGGKELQKLLSELPKKIENKVTRQALRKGAKVIQAQAKANCPVKTGKLRKSIKVRAGKRRKGQASVIVTTSKDDNAFKGETFYGGPVEYGHKAGKRTTNVDLGVKRRKRRTRAQRAEAKARDAARKDVPARPFMRPAFDSKKEEALRVITDEMRAGVEREATNKSGAAAATDSE